MSITNLTYFKTTQPLWQKLSFKGSRNKTVSVLPIFTSCNAESLSSEHASVYQGGLERLKKSAKEARIREASSQSAPAEKDKGQRHGANFHMQPEQELLLTHFISRLEVFHVQATFHHHSRDVPPQGQWKLLPFGFDV